MSSRFSFVCFLRPIAFSGVSDKEDLENDLGNAEYESVTLPAMDDYEKGKVVDLGKIKISREGIRLPKVSLKMSDVGEIAFQRHYSLGYTLFKGGSKSSVNLIFKRRDGRFMAHLPIPDTDNFKTLLQILSATGLVTEED